MDIPTIIRLDDTKSALEALDPVSARWGPRAKSDWVFRGNGDESFELLPSAWRTPRPEPLQNIIDRDHRQIEIEFARCVERRQGFHGRERVVFENAYAEAIATWEFIHFADELGLQTPLPYIRSRREAFILATDAIDGDSNIGKEEEYAAAQHFGIPTRLLDWSLDPLIALFFAAIDEEAHTKHASKDMAVWALKTAKLAELDSDKTTISIAHPFRESNGFLRAQQGEFTRVTTGNTYYREHGAWPSVDQILVLPESENLGADLIKFLIPKACAPEILRVLWRRRISRAHLMPSLQNVAAAISQRWKLESEGEPWTLEG